MKTLCSILLVFSVLFSIAQNTYDRASKLILEEHYDEAVALLTESLTSSKSPKLYYLLSKAYCEQGWNEKLKGNDGSQLLQRALTIGEEAIAQNDDHPYAHLAMGLAFQYNEQYVQAQLAYEKAVEIDNGNAEALYMLWSVVSLPAEQKVASPLIQKSLELDPNQYLAWNKLGDLHRELGQADEAISSYLKAIKIHPEYVSHYSVATVYTYTGELAEAKFHFTQSIILFDEFAWSHYGLASVLLAEGHTEKAVPSLNKAISLNPAVYDYYLQLANNYPELTNYKINKPSQRDRRTSTTGAETYEPEGYRDAIQRAQEERYADAFYAFQKVLLKEASSEQPHYGYIISMKNWMIHCLYQLGQYADAIELAESNFEDTRKYGLAQDRASLLATVAAIYAEWGDYKYAIQFTLLSIELLEELGLEEQLVLAYGNLSEVYRKAGQYEEAIVAGEETIRKCEEQGNDELLIQNYNTIAQAYLLNASLSEALSYLDMGLEQAPGEQLKAELKFTKAEWLNANGEYKQAKTLLEEANSYFTEFRNPRHPSYLRINRVEAFIQNNLGQIAKANQSFERLFELIGYYIDDYFPSMSESGKTLFFRSVKQDFETYNNFVYKNVDRFPALTTSLLVHQSNVRGLLLDTQKKIRQEILQSDDEELLSVFEAWKSKRGALAKLYAHPGSNESEIVQLSSEIESLEITLSKQNSNFKKRKSDKKQINQVKKALGDDEVLISMQRFRAFDFKINGNYLDEVVYAALAVTNDQDPSFISWTNGNELEEKNFSAYQNLMQFKRTDTRSYGHYWSPLADYNSKKIYFIPEGVFHNLNLESLYDPKDDRYLLEQTDIQLINSLGDVLPTEESEATKKALLVGFPDYKHSEDFSTETSGDLPTLAMQSQLSRSGAFEEVLPLPGTLDEVQSLEQRFSSNGWNIDKLLRNEASEQNLTQLDNPTVLHIATHGFFDAKKEDVHPLLSSGLLLAGASSENSIGDDDGVLTAFEALNLQLEETELVVLSACETGKGVSSSNEGVYGLQSALLTAGADNIIMSLWKVDDEATKQLMLHFYDFYLDGETPAKALKKAKMALKEDFPEPYYWAAFVLVGGR